FLAEQQLNEPIHRGFDKCFEHGQVSFVLEVMLWRIGPRLLLISKISPNTINGRKNRIPFRLSARNLVRAADYRPPKMRGQWLCRGQMTGGFTARPDAGWSFGVNTRFTRAFAKAPASFIRIGCLLLFITVLLKTNGSSRVGGNIS